MSEEEQRRRRSLREKGAPVGRHNDWRSFVLRPKGTVSIVSSLSLSSSLSICLAIDCPSSRSIQVANDDSKREQSPKFSTSRPSQGDLMKTTTGASSSQDPATRLQQWPHLNTVYSDLRSIEHRTVEQKENAQGAIVEVIWYRYLSYSIGTIV